MRMRWAIVGAMLGFAGCTAESTRVAIETQRRADQVQEAIFDRQQEGLTLLLYRDAVRRLREAGSDAGFGAMQEQVLNEVWNERDLIEFWRVQHERGKALRLIGVDTKLYSDQSVIDLLLKALSAKAARMNEGIAAAAGAFVAERASEAVSNGGASEAAEGNEEVARGSGLETGSESKEERR